MDSARLPEATSSAIGGVWLPQIAEATTGVQGTIANSTFYDIPGLSLSLEPGTYIITIQFNGRVDSSTLDTQAALSGKILDSLNTELVGWQDSLSMYNRSGLVYGFITYTHKLTLITAATIRAQGRLAWYGPSGAVFTQQALGSAGSLLAVRIA